jgi:hypothetical protein
MEGRRVREPHLDRVYIGGKSDRDPLTRTSWQVLLKTECSIRSWASITNHGRLCLYDKTSDLDRRAHVMRAKSKGIGERRP